MNEKTESKKNKTNPLVVVGIGCLVLLVVSGIGLTVAMKFFAKKIGTNLVSKAIESKTGVKTNLEDLTQGKLSVTDEKTGTSMNIGSNTLPESFPKDFPVYPGAKITASLSGSQSGSEKGFWVTFTTGDSVQRVSEYYQTEFVKNGWEVTANYTAGETTTRAVKKGDVVGSMTTSRESDAPETTIVVTVGE